MVVKVSDPVRQLEHSHEKLTKLTWEIRELVGAWARDGRADAATRARLALRLEALKSDLLEHFANEEEGLFPFIRSQVPAQKGAVARLEADHDALCGAVVRLARLATHVELAQVAVPGPLAEHYERFEATYALHSQHEAALFRGLEGALDERQRAELAKILTGL
jgi:iron-sulfur cluster repair protein YtfE (RIC family)